MCDLSSIDMSLGVACSYTNRPASAGRQAPGALRPAHIAAVYHSRSVWREPHVMWARWLKGAGTGPAGGCHRGAFLVLCTGVGGFAPHAFGRLAELTLRNAARCASLSFMRFIHT